ncbi:MAG: MFS transporter, partial [Burkholderiales bacterium]
ATAAIAKVFSGAISDWLGRRKPLLVLGYGLAALTKPLFPLASGVGEILTARFIDRIGKGIRGAPRDALIADVTPPALRGAAYGLRQSMDTAGAFIGPLLALVLMAATVNNFRLVFWIAVIPALVCVALIVFGVREHEPTREPAHDSERPRNTRRFPVQRSEIARLPRLFWHITALGTLLTLARFSEAFLLLRAENVGLAVTWVPVILIVMNVVYAASAYPFGILSDKINRKVLLTGGIGVLIAADLTLALASNAWIVSAGAALWGLHMGATQGIMTAIIADTAPDDLRGTAFGMFHLITGVALLAASVIAGGLWTLFGPAMTFYAGAMFSAVALVGLLASTRH